MQKQTTVKLTTMIQPETMAWLRDHAGGARSLGRLLDSIVARLREQEAREEALQAMKQVTARGE